MKWIDGLTREEKIRRKENWHQHFAVFPTCVGETSDHHKIYLWLTLMEREGTIHMGYEGDTWWTYKYREIPQ
jgi:hypothetical protein